MTAEAVPAERFAALQRAFDATMKDPEFLADMAKARLDVRPMTGAEMTSTIARIYATPPDVVMKTRRIIGLAQ